MTSTQRPGHYLSMNDANRVRGAHLYGFILDPEGFDKCGQKHLPPTEGLTPEQINNLEWSQSEFAINHILHTCMLTWWQRSRIQVGWNAMGRHFILALVASTAPNDELLPPPETLDSVKKFLTEEGFDTTPPEWFTVNAFRSRTIPTTTSTQIPGHLISFNAASRTRGAHFYGFILDPEGFDKCGQKHLPSTEGLTPEQLSDLECSLTDIAINHILHTCMLTWWQRSRIRVGWNATGRHFILALVASTAPNNDLLPPPETLDSVKNFLTEEGFDTTPPEWFIVKSTR